MFVKKSSLRSFPIYFQSAHEEETRSLRNELAELRRLLNNQQANLGSKSEDTGNKVHISYEYSTVE